MTQKKRPLLLGPIVKEIETQRDRMTRKYLLANVTETQLSSTLTLLTWLEEPTDKQDYIDTVSAIDLNKAFSVKVLNIILNLHDFDPVKINAVNFGIIRRR